MNIFKITACSAVLMIGTASGLWGQVGGIGDPATAPGTPAQSYALSGIDHVNYYSGLVNVSIPLLTFGGRGTVSRTPTIGIERQWFVDETSMSYVPAASMQPPLAATYALGSLLSFFRGDHPSACPTQDAQGTWWYRDLGPFTTYLAWNTGNGTSVILQDTKFNGQPQGADITDCSQLDSYEPANRGRVFRSKDGTNLTFVADQDVLDVPSGGPIAGTLITSDGTKFRFGFDSYVNQIEDRNGNLISIVRSPTNSGSLYTVTDAAGRQETVKAIGSLYYAPTPDTQDVFTYPGYNGDSRSIKVNYAPLGSALSDGESLQTRHCLFPELYGSSVTPYEPYVISSIVLADNTAYTMKYNAYGELTQLTLPTGAIYRYRYAEAVGCAANTGSGVIALANNSGYRISRRVLERDEYADGVNLSGKILFSAASSSANLDPIHSSRPGLTTTVSFQRPDGSLLRQEKHYFYGDPLSTDPPPSDETKYAEWWLGLEFKTETGDGATVLQRQENVYQQRPCSANEPCWFGDPQAESSPAQDVRLCQVNTSLDSATGGIIYTYDQFNNVTDKWEYDYTAAPGIGAGCPLPSSSYLRHTSKQYVGGGYTDPSVNLSGLPSQVAVETDGKQSVTRYFYDESGLDGVSNIVGYDLGFSSSLRGNLTNTAQCLNPPSCSNWVNHRVTYDIAGNVKSRDDGNGNITRYDYSDGQNSYAHITTITYPQVNQRTLSESFTYDYLSGKLVQATDVNGVATTYRYSNPGYDNALERDRLTQIRTAPGGGASQDRHTNYSYDSPTVMRQYDSQTSGYDVQTMKVFDGLGRLLETRSYEDANQYTASRQSYDASGRLWARWNPSRPGDGLDYASVYSYDALGRISSETAPDGSVTSYSYWGWTTTVTDPANKNKQYGIDPLGHLRWVIEDPSGLPNSNANALNLTTNYCYDQLDHLTVVRQGDQRRSFTYDALGRLTNAANPESGAVGYVYDNAGNLTQRTDNRGVVTTYHYDALNRLTEKIYSSDASNTPAVHYSHDNPGVPYGMGRLSAVANGSATENIVAYDALGRVLGSNQQVEGQTYSFAYTYNLAGALTSETYPSGRTVSFNYDGANRVTQVSGSVNTQQKTYASDFNYAPQGAPNWYLYGNNVCRAFYYNSRLQPWAMIDSAVHGAVPSGDCTYPGDERLVQTFNWGTTNNNGNLNSGTTSHGGPDFPTFLTFKTSYWYDGVNRVTAENGKDEHDNLLWGQNFDYDRYGNMWVNGAPAGLPSSGLTPDHNVFTTGNQIQGGSYDAAGNQLEMGAYSLTYDAENRIVHVSQTNLSGGGAEDIVYDGEGRRVEKKIANGPTRVYVYDVFGSMAAEYTTAAAPSTVPCATCYLSQDHLGSTRLVTNEAGGTVARHDYVPFGEEIPAGYGGRDTRWEVADGISRRFTGQERDGEMQLDFFQARYFSGALGRFTSPDFSGLDQDPTNPQSWNLYSYVHNNPLNATDPSGNETCADGSEADACVPGGSLDPVPIDPCWYCGYVPGNPGSGSSEPPIPPPPIVEVGREFLNWLGQPRDPGCMLGATAKGGAIGTGVGLVGGGIAGIGTGPGAAATAYAGAQLLGPPGAAAGYAVGLFTCMSSSGTGGPSSGGGTGEGKVRFGNNPNQEYHTFRHVEEAGIDKQTAEQAIRNDLAGNENTLPQGLTTRQVNVSGRTLQYNAFKLADGTINVGRITLH